MWVAERSLRAACQVAVRRIDLQIEGLSNVPARGPVVLAARHYHHFWDGCALVAVVPRPLHLVVALDWMRNPLGRGAMASACRAVRWPVVFRPDFPGLSGTARATGATRGDAALPLTSARACVDLLRAERALLVFPEGYPNIDPGYTPKRDEADFLPFRAGFLRFVALAERAGAPPVSIVPVGLDYARGDRWRLTIRFGDPVTPGPAAERQALLHEIEARVRRLSGAAPTPAAASAVTASAAARAGS